VARDETGLSRQTRATCSASRDFGFHGSKVSDWVSKTLGMAGERSNGRQTKISPNGSRNLPLLKQGAVKTI